MSVRLKRRQRTDRELGLKKALQRLHVNPLASVAYGRADPGLSFKYPLVLCREQQRSVRFEELGKAPDESCLIGHMGERFERHDRIKRSGFKIDGVNIPGAKVDLGMAL